MSSSPYLTAMRTATYTPTRSYLHGLEPLENFLNSWAPRHRLQQTLLDEAGVLGRHVWVVKLWRGHQWLECPHLHTLNHSLSVNFCKWGLACHELPHHNTKADKRSKNKYITVIAEILSSTNRIHWTICLNLRFVNKTSSSPIHITCTSKSLFC